MKTGGILQKLGQQHEKPGRGGEFARNGKGGMPVMAIDTEPAEWTAYSYTGFVLYWRVKHVRRFSYAPTWFRELTMLFCNWTWIQS